MKALRKLTGAIVAVIAIALLFTGYVYGADFDNSMRNRASRTSPKAGYGSCINPGAGDYGNYVWRNNPAGYIPGKILGRIIEKNQYENRRQYYYNTNRYRNDDWRRNQTWSRYDRDRYNRYDRDNRVYNNRHR